MLKIRIWKVKTSSQFVAYESGLPLSLKILLLLYIWLFWQHPSSDFTITSILSVISNISNESYMCWQYRSMIYLMLSDVYDAWRFLLALYKTCSTVVKCLDGTINDCYFRCCLASYDTHSRGIALRVCTFVIWLHGLICLNLSTGSCTYFRDNEDNCNRTISYHSKPFSEDLHTAWFHRRPV